VCELAIAILRKLKTPVKPDSQKQRRLKMIQYRNKSAMRSGNSTDDDVHHDPFQ
jgi:hypothetical protein